MNRSWSGASQAVKWLLADLCAAEAWRRTSLTQASCAPCSPPTRSRQASCLPSIATTVSAPPPTPLHYPHRHPHHHRPRHRRVPGAACTKAASPGGSSPRQQPAVGVRGLIPRAGPGGVLLPRVHRRLLNTEAEAALTLTLPLTLPPPCYFRLRRCRHCRRHRRRHRRHANAGLCLQCPVRLCRDLEICGACLFTSKVSLISRRGFESSQNTAPATSKRSSAFPAHRRRGASGLVRCPHIFTPSPSPHVAPLHTLVTFDDSGPVLGPQQ